MKNMKKIIISVIAVLLVVTMGSVTFATDTNDGLENWLEGIRQEGNVNAKNDDSVEQIQEGTNNTNTNTNTNTNVNENLPETTPHAGLEDYTGLIFVVVFAASAIYAYKKVNEYNV